MLANLGLGNANSSVTSVVSTLPAARVASSDESVVVAPGIPAIRRNLFRNILSGNYIDFTELPPAKGRVKPLSSQLEGQVVLLSAADLLQTKRLIPDFGTWVQCFTVYAAIVLSRFPERSTSLMLYAGSIGRLSQRFKWPSWVIYDNAFRQEAAESGNLDWSKIDASIHAQCFTGMAVSQESWCSLCHSIYHLKGSCTLKSPDRTSPSEALSRGKRAAYSQTSGPKRFKEWPPICNSYNRNDGACTYMPKCNYRHVCRKCGGPHPETKCLKVGHGKSTPS